MDNFLAECKDNSKSDHCGKCCSDEVHLLSSYMRLCTHISLHADGGQWWIDEGGPSPTVFSAKGNTLDKSVNKLKESLVCQPCASYSHDCSPCPTQSCPCTEVCYMPLFNIKGVDTKSCAYLKSVNTQPKIVHIVPSFKRVRTALTQQHDLLSDQASGLLLISSTYLNILC